MSLVRNNKSSVVSLPCGGKRLLAFKPGTHEYDDDLLDKIETQRASVRAYLTPGPNGKAPVIQPMSDPRARPDPVEMPEGRASDVVAMCKTSSDHALLEKLAAEDQRKTVVAAAQQRLAELEEMATGPGSPDGGLGPDGAAARAAADGDATPDE